jgi:GGDEF domain-containing protein
MMLMQSRTIHETDGQNADGSPTKFQEFHRPPTHEETNQLLGAANFWSIPNADQMDPVHLKQLIETKRLSAEGDRGDLNPVADVVMTAAAAAGLGATQDLLGMAQHMPFIGNAIAENHYVQQSSQWLASLNEGVQAGMEQNERTGYRIAHGLGGMLGYILPGEAAWKVAGAAGGLGAVQGVARVVTSPIARAAIQGAASAWLLEGGGDQSNEEAATKVGLGALGGAFFGELLPRVFEKVKSAFPSASDVFSDIPVDYRGTASRGSNTQDAEWYFEADHQLPGAQRQLPGPGQTGNYGGPEGPSGGGPPRGWNDPSPGQLPGQGRLTPGPDYEVTDDFGSSQIDPSIRVDRQPTQYNPGQPPQLMSPERAAITDRIMNLTEQRDTARRLMETDNLTGLGNKSALERARPTVDADPQLGWAVFDGKQFKAVNDTHGHDVGDQVLQNFGRSIQQAAMEMNIPARAFRQGGDEFAAVVPRDQLADFTRRVSELSYQRVGGVETRLDGYHSGNFAEADLTLMNNKRLARNGIQITEGNLPRPTLDQFVASEVSDRPNITPQGLQARAADVGIDMIGTMQERSQSLASDYEAAPSRDEDQPDHPLNTQAAAGEAANLSKQAQIMESAALPQIASASEIDESDVAKAAMFNNPERINVVKGVGDAGKIVRRLTQGMLEGRIMPHQFRLVERNGQMDMLVSDGLPITSKRVAQYQQHGFFDQQQATANGRDVIISKSEVSPGMARVYDPYTEQVFHVPHDQIMPGNHSAASDVRGISNEGEQLYQDFQNYVQDYMQSEMAKMPPGHKFDSSWLSHETSSQLPRLMEAYLDHAVGSSPLSRAAIESYFNVRRVQDYQSLAPEELGDTYALNQELDDLRKIRPVERMPIEDIASTKGFAYVSDPGTAGGTLVDQLSDLRVPVAHEDAAYEFLRSFNRDLPDYTPVSDVPVEAFGSTPHSANPGNDLEPVLERGAEAEQHLAARVSNDIEATIARVEAGSLGPVRAQPPGGGSPPPPREPFLSGGGMDALPPGRQTLGAQMAEAARSRPQDLYRVLQKFDSAWLQYFTPFRSVALQVEADLKNIGISEGTLWRHYNDVTTAVTQAHNEALPWQAEYADIMGEFRRKLLRTGVVTKVQEIGDYNEKIAAMQREGYTQGEMNAQRRLGDFNDRFFRYLSDDPAFSINDSRYVNAYMSHVRQRQGMPGIQDPFADVNDALPQHLKFFAEMAREGNMQFRQMDARVLGTKMIRAAMFKKHVAEPWHDMASAWDDPRIPNELREVATDWLKVVQTGHNPNYDVAIQGVRHTLNAIGVPITNGEVAALSNVAFGNMYRAQLGGRPDAIFRDSIQPLLSGVRIGMRPIAAAYNKFLSGGDNTREMIQRGLDGGWLEKGQAKVANADVFEAGIQTPQGTDLLTPAEQTRREVLAKIGDLMWEATPKGLRNGLQGTRLDPLLYYTKLGEVNRLVSGEAGYQVAASALADYQYEMGRVMRGDYNVANGQMAVDAMDAAMTKLMAASKAQAYPSPIQEQFKNLVNNGQMQEAAYLHGERVCQPPVPLWCEGEPDRHSQGW